MSEQKSRLAIEIDSQEAVRGAKAVHKELKSIQETGDFAAKSVEGTSKSINQFSQEGAKGASSAKILSDQVKSVGNSSKTASDGLNKVTHSTAASAASMDSATKAAQVLASRIAAIATVGAAVSKMDTFAGFENRLKLVTTSQTELNQAMNDTFRIAQNSRQEWDSVVQVYQRFSENAKTLGIDMKKTAELTETVSKAVAISGASSASAEAALTQFGQALASGVLRGEELNSVMEQTPGLSKAIAQGMGITIGQLRAVAAEGKITTDVLVDALTKSKDSVDELFGKTSMTIGQSMTTLNNEIVKFVGEAGKTSGAAQAIAQSIQLISENLSAISSVAMLGGVAYLTKAILTKGNALRKNASDALAARSAVQVLAVQEQQLAVAVLNDAKAHLASIQATGAATQAKYGATAAALRYKQALDQVSIAQAKVDSLGGSLSKFGSIASKGLALIGGPIGALTIGVTAASAAYGYFSARAEEATQKLAEQAKTADKTDESLKKLTGTERQKAIDDLNDTFKDQAKTLRQHELAVGASLVAIENHYGALSEEAKIAKQAREGVISYDDALKQLNELKINKGMYDRLVAEIPKYDEAAGKIQNTANKMTIFGIEVEIGGNKAQNAAPKVDSNTEALKDNAVAANAAANAQKSYFDALDLQKSNDQHALSFISTGYDVEVAKEINKLRNEKTKANEKAGIFGIDPFIYEWEIDRIKQAVAARYKLADVENAITEAKRKQTRETNDQIKAQEKQNKLLANGARLVGISGNTGKSSGPHLHVQYPMGSKKGGVTAEHMARFQLGGKTLKPNNSNSPYGKVRSDGKKHGGWDFETPVGTPITTNVAVKNVTTHKGDNAGFYSRVTFADGVVIDLMHQVPGIDQKLKGGASDGKSNSLTYKQQESLELKDARESESLSNDYRTITEKDAADHQKRMTDLRKHGLTKEVEMEKARYEKTRELRALEQTLEIDGWRWVGEEKIKNDAAVNRLRIEASIDLGKTEKEQAIESNKELMNYELSAYRRLQQEKMKEFRATIEQQAAEYQGMYYDALAKASMIQPAYARWDAQNSYGDQIGAAWDNKQSAIDQADEKDSTTDQYLNDANTRNQMYLEAEKNYQAALLAIKQKGVLDERELQKNSFDMQLEASESVFGSMTEMLRKSGAERTGIYRAMLVAEKGAAIARSIIAIQTGIAEASANPFPYNIGAMASVAAATASIVSNIQAVSTGFSGGGFTGYGGKYDLAGTVHKGEVVWSQDDIKRWGGPANVDAMRQSSPQSSPMIERQRLAAIGEAKASQQINVQPQITINTPPGVHVETSTDVNGGITIDIVRQEAKQATKDSWGRISDYNSFEAKQVVKSFSVSPRR